MEWLSGNGGIGEIPSHYLITPGNALLAEAEPLSAGAGVRRIICSKKYKTG
jgi:hypothetical protein